MTSTLSIVSLSLTAIQTLVVIVGIKFAIDQIRHLNQTKTLEIIKVIFEDFSEPERYRERLSILAKGKVDIDSMDDEGFILYMRTCDFVQRVGFYNRNGFIPGAQLFKCIVEQLLVCGTVLLRLFIICEERRV